MSARVPRSTIGGYPRPSRPRRRRFSRGLVLSLLALIGAVAGLVMIVLAHRLEPAQDGHRWSDRLALAAGLKPTWADVRGASYTSHSDIAAALALDTAVSQLSYDAAAAERRIEALPWVLRAKVHRILPAAIGVEISEREAAILWRAADRDMLVDMTGRLLTTVPRGSDIGLPVVTGEDAGPAAPDLMVLVRTHPEIQRRMIEARRIEGRRWTLLLVGGTLLHLPGDGVAAALAWIEAQAANGLLDRNLAAIDMRVPGQLVVRDAVTSRTANATPSSGGAP